MRHGLFSAVSAVLVVSLLAGCGQSTPDTEGQTLAQAQQTLRDAGVSESNITVTNESGDPNSLIVCDHDPDNADPSEPLTLQVAQSCPDDDDGKKKKKKKSSSSKRR